VLSPSRKRYLDKASKEYASQLTELRPGNDPSGGISYLSSHSINFTIASKYQLGYVGKPLPGDERFAGRLAIPYITPAGVVSIKFRSLSAGGAKYIYHSGQKNHLYNTKAYFDAGIAIGISEGEMDAISATEHLGLPTLGVPGVEGGPRLRCGDERPHRLAGEDRPVPRRRRRVEHVRERSREFS
jgi:hypothetical protein